MRMRQNDKKTLALEYEFSFTYDLFVLVAGAVNSEHYHITTRILHAVN